MTGRVRAEMPECGTLRGWSAHRNRGEEPCDVCRKGRSAHQRALIRLMKLHPLEFRRLLAEEIDNPSSQDCGRRDAIRAANAAHPEMTRRQLADATGVSYACVLRMVKRDNLTVGRAVLGRPPRKGGGAASGG
jgi:hypothetical protein